MNFRTMSAADQQVLIAGAVIAITGLISFVDPAGSWGGIMIVSVLAGVAAAWALDVTPELLAAGLRTFDAAPKQPAH
jgi:hypothetical protein